VFGIFDLAFPVDPTIFVRESFIFAGNFSRRCDRSSSLASLQQNEAAMDLLRPRAKKGGGAQKKGGGARGTRIVARED